MLVGSCELLAGAASSLVGLLFLFLNMTSLVITTVGGCAYQVLCARGTRWQDGRCLREDLWWSNEQAGVVVFHRFRCGGAFFLSAVSVLDTRRRRAQISRRQCLAVDVIQTVAATMLIECCRAWVELLLLCWRKLVYANEKCFIRQAGLA